MQKQSENWPGVQYPLKKVKLMPTRWILHIMIRQLSGCLSCRNGDDSVGIPEACSLHSVFCCVLYLQIFKAVIVLIFFFISQWYQLKMLLTRMIGTHGQSSWPQQISRLSVMTWQSLTPNASRPLWRRSLATACCWRSTRLALWRRLLKRKLLRHHTWWILSYASNGLAF